jgi:hypothetical protein
MDSINDRTTARAMRVARHARATCFFGIVTLSGAFGCAAAPGGIGPREPDFASIARCRTSPLGVAPLPSPAAEANPFASARPPSATLARERELADASSFAAIGLLATRQTSDTEASIGAWGTPLDRADDVSEAGRFFFGKTIDDAPGFGGLRFSDLEKNR